MSSHGRPLGETEAVLEDEREADISIIVAAARSAARRRDPSLLALFEKTVRYNGHSQIVGAKTRRRNAKASANAATPPAPAPGAPAPGAPAPEVNPA